MPFNHKSFSPRAIISLFSILILCLMAQNTVAQLELGLRIDSTTAWAGDSMVTVGVYLDNPLDSVAAFELTIIMSRSDQVEFCIDDTTAIDTTGTILSGFNIGYYPPSSNHYLRILASKPHPTAPALAPQTGGLLFTLNMKVYDSFPNSDPDSITVLQIIENPGFTGFSDPYGDNIGLVVEYEYDTTWYSCIEWDGPVCIDSVETTEEFGEWFVEDISITSYYDTNAVSFDNGYVRVVYYNCGDANGDGIPNVGDAVFLINYVFNNGPAPDQIETGDANGDGLSNVADAVYMINFVFKNGPDPTCGQ